MRFTAANTSIRVPKVRRSFNVPGPGIFETIGYIAMDYVDGTCLADCWNDLSPRIQQNVVLQVAEFIRQLQSVRLNNPGPLGGGPSQGTWFTDYGAGPFTNRQEIENWFNHKLAILRRKVTAHTSVFGLVRRGAFHQQRCLPAQTSARPPSVLHCCCSVCSLVLSPFLGLAVNQLTIFCPHLPSLINFVNSVRLSTRPIFGTSGVPKTGASFHKNSSFIFCEAPWYLMHGAFY